MEADGRAYQHNKEMAGLFQIHFDLAEKSDPVDPLSGAIIIGC